MSAVAEARRQNRADARLSPRRERRIAESIRNLGAALDEAARSSRADEIDARLLGLADEAASLAMKYAMRASVATNRGNRDLAGRSWKQTREAVRLGIEALYVAVGPLLEEEER